MVKRINDIEGIKKESKCSVILAGLVFAIGLATYFLYNITHGLVFFILGAIFLMDKRYWDTKRNIIEFTKNKR